MKKIRRASENKIYPEIFRQQKEWLAQENICAKKGYVSLCNEPSYG
jgi:hypothetical protein